MEPRNTSRRRGYAGAAPQPVGPAKAPLQWKQILLTALITGAGFYIGSRIMKAAAEKGDETDSIEEQRAALLGGSPPMMMPGAVAPMYAPAQPVQQAGISAAPDGKSILITPEALARLQAGR